MPKVLLIADLQQAFAGFHSEQLPIGLRFGDCNPPALDAWRSRLHALSHSVQEPRFRALLRPAPGRCSGRQKCCLLR